MTESERFTTLLNLKKISKSEFAERVGTSNSNLTNWSKNNVLPEGNLIKKILEAYPDFDVIWWFTGNENNLSKKNIEKERRPLATENVSIIEILAKVIEQLTMQVNEMPDLRERIAALEKEMEKMKADK